MFLLRIILISSFFAFSSVVSAAPYQNDSRVKFINKLINISSGAKQVLKSDDAAVKVLHSEAKALLVQAQQQFEMGEKSKGSASALLDRSAATMFKAIRLASPKSIGDHKLEADFKKRKSSVTALGQAFKRIAKEQERETDSEQVNQQLIGFEEEADKLMRAGKIVEARAELDKAYHLIKISIESMRGGQTLVRSLNFATPEDEYHYEIDRNNTHKMLVKLFLSEKKVSAYGKKMADKSIKEANKLRAIADREARAKQFSKAIKLLEQSTKQLVRAIRSSGIYIPG